LPTVGDARRAATPVERTTAEPASLGRRFGALLIDWILCVMVGGLFGDPRHSLAPLAVLVVEYAFFIGMFTQTPGMYVTSVRCVGYPHGGRLGVFRAALRGLLLCLVVPAVLMDGERRGWHDRAAGSIVVAARATPPS
jgi:uncharacterized RDD family membrane protein YckC